MPETLLRTKLLVPEIRPNLVSRPRLIEELDQGLHQGCKLILISAPADFGKTSPVSELVAINKRRWGRKHAQLPQLLERSFIFDDIAFGKLNAFLRKPRFL